MVAYARVTETTKTVKPQRGAKFPAHGSIYRYQAPYKGEDCI